MIARIVWAVCPNISSNKLQQSNMGIPRPPTPNKKNWLLKHFMDFLVELVKHVKKWWYCWWKRSGLKPHLGWCNQMPKTRRKIMGISTTQDLNTVNGERRISGCHEPYSTRYRNHLASLKGPPPSHRKIFLRFEVLPEAAAPLATRVFWGEGSTESTVKRPDFGGKGTYG